MSPQTLIRRAYQAFAERDAHALRELAVPDVEVRTMTGVLAERSDPYRGHEGIEQYLDDVTRVWDELELEPVEFHELESGGTLVYGRVRARRGSMRMDSANAWLWRLSGDKVTSVEVFGELGDAAALLRGEG
jgi:ketosteroid isomerase-like protein